MKIKPTPEGMLIKVLCKECGAIGYATKPSHALMIQNEHFLERHGTRMIFEMDAVSTICLESGEGVR